MIGETLSLVSRREEIQRFQALHADSLGELTEAVREGVPATSVRELATLLGMPVFELSAALGISPSTIRRKSRKAQLLAVDQGERVIWLQRIVGLVQHMVEKCGDPTEFDAAQWTGKWLRRTQPCLGGKRPLDYLDSVTGQQLLSGLLMQNVGGTYA